MRLSATAGIYAVVVAILVAELILPAELLEYRRALAFSEPWRLLTGHFVHLSFLHALLNGVALLLPELQWYRGLSGVLHAIFFAGCVAWIAQTAGRARWLPVAAIIGGAAKVLLEQPWDASFPVHEWLRVAVVPQAHLIGAVIGTAAGLVLRQRRQQAQPQQQQERAP